MPWRVAIGGPEAAIAVATVVASTLGVENLWQSIQHKIQPPKAATASAVQQPNELFSDKDFAYIQASCNRGPATTPTAYGNWHTIKDCTLPARGRRSLTLPLDEALYNRQNKVVGFKRMLITEVRRDFYQKNLTSSITEERKICAKFGQSTFPLVIVVKKDLCDSLAYNQV